MKRQLFGVMKKLAKNMAKLMLRVVGYYPSRIRTNMEDALNHLRSQGIAPNTIFDVGVANGTEELYEAFPHSHIILIEPLVEFDNYMKHVSKKYNMTCVLAAASNKEGNIRINVHDDLCGSSILKEVEGKAVDGAKRTVETIRIDEYARKKNLKPPYIIKVDVQGAELTVLDGAKGIMDDTDAIILEVSLFKFFIDGPEFYDVISYMKMQNFVVYDIFDGRLRPLDNALAQVDILFVRENGFLRSNHYYATNKQRQNQTRKLQKRMKW